MQENSIRRASAFGGFDILESRVSHFEYSPHRHAEVVIAAYYAGHKIATCGHERYEITHGDLLVIGPETLHMGSTGRGPGWHYLSLYLDPSQISTATGLSMHDVEPRVEGSRLVRDSRIGATFRHLSDEPLELSSFLVDLFADAALFIVPVRPSKGLLRVRDYLIEHTGTAPELADLAKLADISPEHLSRQFRAMWGLSPFQFLTVTRARDARARIAAGYGLADAAMAAGFADQSHMTRWFRRIYGVTPGAFAAAHQMRSRQG